MFSSASRKKEILVTSYGKNIHPAAIEARIREIPGVAEVLLVAEQPDEDAAAVEYSSRLRDLLPNREEWRRSIGPIGRGSVLGFLLGLLPGGGALIASFASYVMDKRWSKTPEVFGHGAIEGVAGPESANNSAAQSAFVPLLCLGIPSNAVMGVIMGALLIHGVTPGPKLIVEQPSLRGRSL